MCQLHELFLFFVGTWPFLLWKLVLIRRIRITHVCKVLQIQMQIQILKCKTTYKLNWALLYYMYIWYILYIQYNGIYMWNIGIWFENSLIYFAYTFVLHIGDSKGCVDRNGSVVYCTGYERMRSIKAKKFQIFYSMFATFMNYHLNHYLSNKWKKSFKKTTSKLQNIYWIIKENLLQNSLRLQGSHCSLGFSLDPWYQIIKTYHFIRT